jgi:hypothetical protein
MLKVWPECFDDVFTIWNGSNSWLLLVLGTRCLLCGMWVLAALLHLQTVMGLGHSLQFDFLCVFLQFQVGFSFCCLQFYVIVCQYSVIGWSKLPNYDFFPKGLPSGYRLSPADHFSPKVNAGIHLDSMWYDREYVACHVGVIGLLWVYFLLLTPPVGYIQIPYCTANSHVVEVVIIQIGNNLAWDPWQIRQ